MSEEAIYKAAKAGAFNLSALALENLEFRFYGDKDALWSEILYADGTWSQGPYGDDVEIEGPYKFPDSVFNLEGGKRIEGIGGRYKTDGSYENTFSYMADNGDLVDLLKVLTILWKHHDRSASAAIIGEHAEFWKDKR